MTDEVRSFELNRIKYDSTAMLGEGGTAEVFHCTTPDGQRRILKLYRDEDLADVDFEALRHTIAWPTRLAPEDSTRLLALSAWPQGLVYKLSTPVGIVMPVAPDRYFLRRNGKIEPRHIVRLAVEESRATKGGYEYFDFPQKISRLGHVLGGLQFLHSIGIVVGDLQFNNLLTTSPGLVAGETRSDVHFLDCDSFIVDGRAGLTNMDPISWRPRYQTDGFSTSTDLFKFALMVIRSLSEQTNQDSIAFAQYKELLPSDDFGTLHELLTSPTPAFGAKELSGMARAWQLSVRRDGTMYRRTDNFARQMWTPQMRGDHLMGIQSSMDKERVVPLRNKPGSSVGSGKSPRRGSLRKTIPERGYDAVSGPIPVDPPATSKSPSRRLDAVGGLRVGDTVRVVDRSDKYDGLVGVVKELGEGRINGYNVLVSFADDIVDAFRSDALKVVDPSKASTLRSKVAQPSISSGQTSKNRAGWWALAAIVAVVFTVGSIVIANVNSHNSTSSSSSSTMVPATPSQVTTTTTEETTTATTTSFAATDSAIRAASIGDCIHKDVGASKGDGTSEVTVSRATCGTSYSTSRVTDIVDAASRCVSGDWVQSSSPNLIVLCLTSTN